MNHVILLVDCPGIHTIPIEPGSTVSVSVYGTPHGTTKQLWDDRLLLGLTDDVKGRVVCVTVVS